MGSPQQGSFLLRAPNVAAAAPLSPGSAESRKGTRQPQVSISSGPRHEFSSAISALAKAQAIWLPTEIMHTAMPSVCIGDTSILTSVGQGLRENTKPKR